MKNKLLIVSVPRMQLFQDVDLQLNRSTKNNTCSPVKVTLSVPRGKAFCTYARHGNF